MQYSDLTGVILFFQRWHEYRVFRRQGPSLADAGREAYLRTDISCGSEFCRSCDGSSHKRLIQAAHYALPDKQTLTDLLELLELPEFQDVILLNSIVKPVCSVPQWQCVFQIRQNQPEVDVSMTRSSSMVWNFLAHS